MNKRPIKPFSLFFNVFGIDEQRGDFFTQPDGADYIENMHVDSLGQWTPYNQGYSHLTSQQEGGVSFDALGWYTDASGTDYLLAAINGKIKNIVPDSGVVTSTISTSFTAGDVVDFETFKGTVYAASPNLAVQKWSGTGSMAAAGGWGLTVGSDTFDKPKYLKRYANRLAFANFQGATQYPAHVVLSDDLSPETFTFSTPAADTDALVVQVSPGDGQEITGLSSMMIPQTNDQVLVIFKERSIYALTGDTPSTFNLFLVNPNFGALNNRCIVQVGTDILFLDQNNIYSLTTANTSGTMQPKPIGSEKVKDTLGDLNISQGDKAWAIHLPWRREVWFGIPTGSNTSANKILVYYYGPDAQGNSASAWSVRTGTTENCAVVIDKTLLTGGNEGYIHTWFASSTYAGTGYNWTYRYRYYNFGSQAQNKRVLDLFAWFYIRDEETIMFKAQWRGGGNSIERTMTKTIGTSGTLGALYGTVSPPAAVYGTDVYGAGSVLKKVKIPVIGNGEQIQFTISGTSGSTAPEFLGLSGLVEFMGYSRSYK